MRQFAANISIIFPGMPYLDRFRAAADAGFRWIESWWPSDELAGGVRSDDIAGAANRHELRMLLLNFAGGNLAAGDRGLASDPAHIEAFGANVPVAIQLARRLGCRKLNVLAGRTGSDAERPDRLELPAASIAFAADAAARFDMTVLLEPLNAREVPGYLLPDVASALEFIERVDRDNVGLQLDVYHVAMAGQDPVAAILDAGPHIGHVQLADVLGRHEPGSTSQPALRSLALREPG